MGLIREGGGIIRECGLIYSSQCKSGGLLGISQASEAKIYLYYIFYKLYFMSIKYTKLFPHPFSPGITIPITFSQNEMA